ncbi:ribonuclease [Tianweitania sp. BSSL-BM11]|uniref:Ribonuclease n=1 Tax=Tianweitania aestuarii TaxID=2814886 RepID=A0ABS5RSI8_9HYPH|nr:ribonuclease [Tianweitania aestuarii]MBS9720015.1 ribonuclease [Tianweitania aestuarii]
MRAGLCLAATLLLAACQPPESSSGEADAPPSLSADAIPQGTGFDFYVLSLSWSPSYCQAEGEQANRQQCGRRDPHGFVVHGLWPQFERGYPEFCKNSEPDRVPDSLVADYRDLIPSAGLIGHQWRKHGSCSGLSQVDYFATTRAARDRITIPAALNGDSQPVSPKAIEDALTAANPGLEARDMAVSCKAGLIREVRICLSKNNLDFRACPEIDRQGCSRPASMPEAR